MLDHALRALLVCPVDKSPLRDDAGALVCVTCGRRYPIIDDIPRMIPYQPAAEESA